MTILGLLQNTWAWDYRRVQESLDRAEESGNRQSLIARLMFTSKCRTGRVLQRHLGTDLCSEIIWDEASRTVTGFSWQNPRANLAHVEALVDQFKPQVLVSFGRVSSGAVRAIFGDEPLEFKWIECPHPAVQHRATGYKLLRVRDQIQQFKDAQSRETLHETFSK